MGEIASPQTKVEVSTAEEVKNSTQGRQEPSQTKVWKIPFAKKKKITVSEKEVSTKKKVPITQTEKQVEVEKIQVSPKKGTWFTEIVSEAQITFTSQASP